MLTVGSVDDAGAVAAYSGRGLDAPDKPDLLAPGGGLLTSGGRIIAADNEPNDTYSGRFGTSLAAAHVAGAVHLLDEALLENGVILPAEPNVGPDPRRAVLKLTAAPVIQAENSAGTGHCDLAFPAGPDASAGLGAAADRRGRRRHSATLCIPGQDQVDTLTVGLATNRWSPAAWSPVPGFAI